MRRSNFLKGLLAIPVAVKAASEVKEDPVETTVIHRDGSMFQHPYTYQEMATLHRSDEAVVSGNWKFGWKRPWKVTT